MNSESRRSFHEINGEMLRDSGLTSRSKSAVRKGLLPIQVHFAERFAEVIDVPNDCRGDVGGAGEELAVAGEGEAADLAGARFELRHAIECGAVPENDRPLLGPGCEVTAVGGERDGTGRAGMAGEVAIRGSRLKI